MSEPWLSADGIAQHLGVTKDTICAGIADEGTPAHKTGRQCKFRVSEVDVCVPSGGTGAGEAV